MVVVVASFLPGEAATALATHPVECVGPLDYFRGLAEVWGRDETIINIEHDVEATPERVDELLACSQPLCAVPYLIKHLRPQPFYGCAAGLRPWDGWTWFRSSRWVEPGETWADFASPGFIKAAASARRPLGPECAWQGVEVAIADAVCGRWHLHWPAVEHGHD